MGQYHRVVNLTKREFIHPSKFGDGVKLLEFGDSSVGTMTALAILLASSCKGGGRGGGDVESDDSRVGSWAGNQIAIVGDYAEESDLPAEFQANLIYQQCLDGFYQDISEEMKAIVDKECH